MMWVLKSRVLWAVVASAALTFGGSAEGIDGVYRVEGHSPDSTETYKGEAQIKKTGETYTVIWRIGESGHVGTGILRGNVLSVFFQPLDRRAAPGVASFLITDDKVTEGTWTILGGKSVGVERWIPDRGL